MNFCKLLVFIIRYLQLFFYKLFRQQSKMSTLVGSKILKSFSGDGDVVAWVTKVKLVARLKGVKQLEIFLPLYLEGDALALYLQLEEHQQADAAEIERKLIGAFADGLFVAHRKLMTIRWSGEQVDVFCNEIRRLGSLAGFGGGGLD